VFARKQSTNPLALDVVLPLLRLIRGAGATEGDLANKASGILRNRLGKAKDVPSSTDLPHGTSILEEIHSMARKASSADFSALFSACSLFVSRAIDTAHPTSRVVVDTYRATLEDWMTRKSSLVHPNFISDFLRRFPLRAWPLREDLIAHTASGKGINAFRQAQAFGMLQIFSQQLGVIVQSQSQSTSSEDVAAFVSSASAAVYATLVLAADESGADWKADRLRDVLKFALALARSAKAVLSPEQVVAAWDLPRLRETRDKFAAGSRTGGMKAILLLINQLEAVLGGGKKDKEGQKAAKAAKATKVTKNAKGKKSSSDKTLGEHEQDDKMDVDVDVDVDADEEVVSAVAPSSQDGKKVKKLKPKAESSVSKVTANPSVGEDKKGKAKKRKVDAGEKPSKKVKVKAAL
jgi:DNA polymerase phi